MGVITLDHGVAVGDSPEMNHWMWHFFVPDLDDPEHEIHPDQGEKWMRSIPHVLRGWTMYAVLTEQQSVSDS